MHHHHQATSLFLSPIPFWSCGGGVFDADGVTSLVLKSLFVVFRAAWKPTSNTVSFPFPPSHHYTTTTCTACMLALLLAAIINHDHQGDKMLRRFTAKAGAMARRGSTLPGPGKGRVLRGGFSSTAHTGPGTSSGEELGKKWATFFQGIGAVVGVAGATAVVVRTFDQTEIKYVQSKAAAEIARVEDKAAAEIAQAKAEIAQAKADVARVEDKRTMSEVFWKAEVERFKAKAEIAQAKADVARVEDKRTMSEVFWKAEVERFKREVQLAFTQDYEPYQAALVDKRKKRGGTSGSEEKEEEN
ncbi:hypothetical protein Naga_101373g3 [Nannochloropsis gaditana]|uniref:Uncharacterized protein n=1 Tax=Nannochloropsis gaditana TaxID=72520 RepID=W7TIR0_9STRA|nr:hypothetical protein Naga_101373g3 [Nannochloropsis gaditana]